MTDYAATAFSAAGSAVTERSGATSGDTVPAGSKLLIRNTGAGSHTFTITTSNTEDGLPVDDKVITLTAGQVWQQAVLVKWGNTNGLCPVAVNGTASEVKYYVLQ